MNRKSPNAKSKPENTAKKSAKAVESAKAGKRGPKPLTPYTATWMVTSNGYDPNEAMLLYGSLMEDQAPKGTWTQAIASHEITIWRQRLVPQINEPPKEKKNPKRIATWRVMT